MPVSAADPAADRDGSGACRSEEAEEKEPVVWGLGGWGRPRPGTAYRARCQERWAALAAAGGGSCLPPKTENRGSFILAPLHSSQEFDPLCAQGAPILCLFPAAPSYLSPARPHASRQLSLPNSGLPGMFTQAVPPRPARELTSSGVPRTGQEGRVSAGAPSCGVPPFLAGRGGVGLPLRPVSLLTCSLTPFLLFVSSLFWSLFLLSERLSLQPHLASPSLIGLLQSLSHSFSPPPSSRTFPSVFLFLSQIFSPLGLSESLFLRFPSRSLPPSLPHPQALPLSLSLSHRRCFLLSLRFPFCLPSLSVSLSSLLVGQPAAHAVVSPSNPG